MKEMGIMVTSEYVKRGDTAVRRSRLLAASLEEVARLEKAAAEGWDVAKDLAKARAHVEAFSK